MGDKIHVKKREDGRGKSEVLEVFQITLITKKQKLRGTLMGGSQIRYLDMCTRFVYITEFGGCSLEASG